MRMRNPVDFDVYVNASGLNVSRRPGTDKTRDGARKGMLGGL